MRDYSKVSASFWTGKTGRAIRSDHEAQIVALYLMTSPHANMIGVFQCPILYIAHETGCTFEGASKGLRRLEELVFCTYDIETETVWVHEMAHFQIGDALAPNDKQVFGVQKKYDALPEGHIKSGFFAKYGTAYHLIEDRPKRGMGASSRKPLGSSLEAPPKPGTGTGTGTGENHMPADAGESAGLVTFAGNVVPIGPLPEIAKPVTGPPARPEPVPDHVGAKARRSGSEVDHDFAEWYENYPRHVGRGKALKAYRSARKKVSKETLLEALRKDPRPEFSDPRYVPYPATWLNAERWADERTAPSAGADAEKTFPSGIYKGLL